MIQQDFCVRNNRHHRYAHVESTCVPLPQNKKFVCRPRICDARDALMPRWKHSHVSMFLMSRAPLSFQFTFFFLHFLYSCGTSRRSGYSNAALIAIISSHDSSRNLLFLTICQPIPRLCANCTHPEVRGARTPNTHSLCYSARGTTLREKRKLRNRAPFSPFLFQL